MIIQLNPPIPVRTPKGVAIAHLIIDDGLEHDLKWVCFQDSTGECWTFRNRFIRADVNITQGREHISPYYKPEDVAFNQNEEVIDPSDEFDEEYSRMADKINEYSEEICNLKIQIENLKLENEKLNNEQMLHNSHLILKSREDQSSYIKVLETSSADLCDYLLTIAKLKLVQEQELDNLFDILRKNGVSESDIKVIGKGQIVY